MANNTVKSVTKVAAVVLGFVLAPAFITAQTSAYAPLSGALPQQIVGDPCAVRVYHTNFNFPPEGGKIILVGNEMFYIKDWKPGCAQAGAGAPVIVASTTSYNPAQTSVRTGYYVNPFYSNGTQVTSTAPTPASVPLPNSTPNCY